MKYSLIAVALFAVFGITSASAQIANPDNDSHAFFANNVPLAAAPERSTGVAPIGTVSPDGHYVFTGGERGWDARPHSYTFVGGRLVHTADCLSMDELTATDRSGLRRHAACRSDQRPLVQTERAKALPITRYPLLGDAMEFQLRTALCLTALALLPVTGLAQTHSHGYAATTLATAPSAPMTEGEVRNVNRVEGTMTLCHGPPENLGMPAMTMTFRTKDAAMLDRVKEGDKVRFVADNVGGKLTVVQLEGAR